MARKPRIFCESGVHHVILRGNDQQSLFYDDSDKQFFIERMHKYSKETKINLYSYTLMSNHVHMLLGNGRSNMSLFIQKLTCSYVYRFNKKYNRSGHLFQGRYKSEPVETSDYFMKVYRYILQNPEKAGICVYFSYRWSSFINERTNPFIDYNFILSIFKSEKAKKAYLNTVNEDSCMEYRNNGRIYRNDDEEKILFIKQLFNIENLLDINKEPDNLLSEKLSLLKKCGLPISQISRLLGISRYKVNCA